MVEAESLIDEVETRPALYDKNLADYTNKSVKDALWMDVACVLIDEWDDLSEVERGVKSRELQFKWKHIRDNYRRELLAQKKKTSQRKRKRKYKYFERLNFLKDHVYEVKRPIMEDVKAKDDQIVETDDDDENTETQIIIAEELDSPPSITRPPPRNTYARMTYTPTHVSPSDLNHRKKKRKRSIDEDSVKLSTVKERMETDEDKTFCLSLVSSLKKMCDTTKLNAKIDILKVIRQYTVPAPYDSPAHTFDDIYNNAGPKIVNHGFIN